MQKLGYLLPSQTVEQMRSIFREASKKVPRLVRLLAPLGSAPHDGMHATRATASMFPRIQDMEWLQDTLPEMWRRRPTCAGHSWVWRQLVCPCMLMPVNIFMSTGALCTGRAMSSCSDHWRKNLPVLGLKCRAFAIDLLGYGYSDKPSPQ